MARTLNHLCHADSHPNEPPSETFISFLFLLQALPILLTLFGIPQISDVTLLERYRDKGWCIGFLVHKSNICTVWFTLLNLFSR